MTKQPTLKILVGYHKPAKLYKDDIYVPIHLGRSLATLASKDGKMSKDDYQWMVDNMIGDDTGDNISELNRHFCELTAIYWAWKNYDKLGNPDYIGLAHYRRLFKQEDINNAFLYDITAPQETLYKDKSVEAQFLNSHHTDSLEQAVSMLDSAYKHTANQYLQGKSSYLYNMFIMKKELFFEYCQFLFDVIFTVHKNTNYQNLSYYNQRMPGFIAERLSGIFFTEKEKCCKVKKCQHLYIEKTIKKEIFPQFDKEAITVCLSADNNYAPYLGITIASIKANRALDDKYEIFILDGGLEETNKKRILFTQEKNFSIHFTNIKAYLDDLDTSIFSLNAHFTIASYFRLFIPQIFKNFAKILYLDCDLIVHHNLAELYKTDLQDFALAAAPDIEMHRCLMIDSVAKGKTTDYLTHKLSMNNPKSYFQAGVLLLDIKKLQKMNFTDVCLKKLAEIRDPWYVDQCVLNAVFDGNYQPLDMKWNVLWQLPYYIKDLDKQLNVDSYNQYFSAYENPYIIHYAGAIKPWKDPSVTLADIWWQYARNTSVYELLLSAMIQEQQKANIYAINYISSHHWKLNLQKIIYKIKMKFGNKKKRAKYDKKFNYIKNTLKAQKAYIKKCHKLCK